MKKMTIRKMLERTTNKRRAKNSSGQHRRRNRGSGIRCGPDPNTGRLEYPVGSNRHF